MRRVKGQVICHAGRTKLQLVQNGPVLFAVASRVCPCIRTCAHVCVSAGSPRWCIFFRHGTIFWEMGHFFSEVKTFLFEVSFLTIGWQVQNRGMLICSQLKVQSAKCKVPGKKS